MITCASSGFRLLGDGAWSEERRSLRGEGPTAVVNAIPALGIHADSWLVEQDDSRTMENAARDVEPRFMPPENC
jgi:hypothetical protein